VFAAPTALRRQAVKPRARVTPASKGVLQRCEGVVCPPGSCRHDEQQTLQRVSDSRTGPAMVPPIVDEVLGSPGQALDVPTRRHMESRFGHDFSQVRVHTNAQARESARAVHAQAYTVDRHIVMGSDYRPYDQETRQLLAHELAHVVQQRNQPSGRPGALHVSDPGDAAELEAERIAQATQAPGQGHVRVQLDAGASLQRRQLKSELHPTGKAHLYADQAASIYFETKNSVPDKDDETTLKALAQEYLYTAQRRGELRGKVIGHAAAEMSGDPGNQELSLQRARSTAAVFRSYVADAAALPPANLQFEAEGAGTSFCLGDPACKRKAGPDALAQYQRADIIIFTEEMPSPQASNCPPTSGNGVKTIGEYIELIRCAEAKTGLDPRKMLALLRQMYYGKPWSATAKDPNWDSVIPCSPDIGDPKDKLGQPLFDALHSTVTIEGMDLGHIFAGLEAMTCPAPSVTLEKSKFGVGIKLTVDLSNESFATWGGDIGSVAGVFVACWMMTNEERATKGKDKCHQGSMPESLEQYFVKPWAAPPADLEGDIAPFVIRAAERGACGGSLDQAFTPRAPISQIFTNFFYNRGPAGMTSRDRYQCFAEAIGATVSNGKITNRAALINKYHKGVLSFAWAYYVNFKKEIPRSDPIVPLLDRNATAVLHLFFDWLQARMRP
jgi:outer membrane protein OmpA-like peptidoglycan-associated protein